MKQRERSRKTMTQTIETKEVGCRENGIRLRLIQLKPALRVRPLSDKSMANEEQRVILAYTQTMDSSDTAYLRCPPGQRW